MFRFLSQLGNSMKGPTSIRALGSKMADEDPWDESKILTTFAESAQNHDSILYTDRFTKRLRTCPRNVFTLC